MKKLRPEVTDSYQSIKGFGEYIDNAWMYTFNITLSELDYFNNNCSEEEMETLTSLLLESCASFSLRKRAWEIRNKYLKLYNEQCVK